MNNLRKVFVSFTMTLIAIMTIAVIMPEAYGSDKKEASTPSIEANGLAGISYALSDQVDIAMSNINVTENDASLVAAPSPYKGPTDVIKQKDVNDAVEEEVDLPVIDEHRKDVNKTFYVNASTLNVRKEPSTDSDVIEKLKCNDKIEVTEKVTVYIDGEKQPSWYKLKDRDGYVSADYMSDEEVLECLGTFRITYYCSCAKCCGKVSHTTASGATTVEGVTIAADPSIPFGTKLMINDHVYTVQDRGGAIKGNHIDIYMSSHSKALSQTYVRGPVYKIP